MSVFTVKFDHLTHEERVLTGFWPGFRKKIKRQTKLFFLELHSKLWEYLCNWADSVAAFSGFEAARAAYKYVFELYRNTGFHTVYAYEWRST